MIIENSGSTPARAMDAACIRHEDFEYRPLEILRAKNICGAAGSEVTSTSCPRKIMRICQAVRHSILTAEFTGSNPVCVTVVAIQQEYEGRRRF